MRALPLPCRLLAFCLALCYLWSFLLAGGAVAAQSSTPGKTVSAHALRGSTLANTPYENVAVLARLAPSAPSRAVLTAPRRTALTLLDEVGRLSRTVHPAQVKAWQQELRGPGLIPARKAQLHLWLGEWILAHDEQPAGARQHWQETLALTGQRDPLHGLAVYDAAISRFYEGEYDGASEAFYRLVVPRTALRGYDRRTCVLWWRHASACAGYHAQHAALGIPEPPFLDPFCGVASLAACLRSLKLPYDQKTLVAACRVTGEGSNMADLVAAGAKLGVSIHSVAADEQGLKLLPKPLVAYVERDHFVAVVKADKSGVSYLCSDCGMWPGGRVDLTWAQWRTMNPGIYAVVTRPGTAWDTRLAALQPDRTSNQPTGLRVAYAGALSQLHLSARLALPGLLSALASHVQYLNPSTGTGCGIKINSQKCPPFILCCWDCYRNALANGGPTGGDPVNLATGEEEYQPASDLTVYNPTGPSVTWQRLYNSLRGPGQDGSVTLDRSYQSDDFGIGWSQTYNVGVNDPTLAIHGLVPQGGSYSFAPTFSYTAYGMWAIYNPSGTLIADYGPPTPGKNGWNVTDTIGYNGQPYVSSITVSAPAGTALGKGYIVVVSNGPGGNDSAYFDVVASGSAGGTQLESAPGTKYVLFPNGSRASFNTPSAPTASQPKVACSVQAGAPMLVDWDYDPNSPAGYYTVTMADRTQWVLNTPSGITQCYALTQLVDRNGNAITFHYGAAATVGNTTQWPLLSSITDGAGSTLLTVNRASDGTGSITSVSDRYGRSVSYHVGAYTTYNVPSVYAQSYQELDHVSLVVPTGTSSPPDRYAYGYQNVNNNENGEQVPSLHTLTVPSPAGPAPATASLTVGETGTSTATINYDPQTALVASVVDGNGNTHTYTAVASLMGSLPPAARPERRVLWHNAHLWRPDFEARQNPAARAYDYSTNPNIHSNDTKVTVTDPQGHVVFAYVASFDNNMSATVETDGAGTAVSSSIYSDPNDPYRPSSVTDGNSKTTSYTWDSFGNLKSMTTPRGTVTTKTWSYTNFALGELTSTQEGTKTATSYTYFEPSGLTQSVSTPTPGTVGGGTVTTSYTYDGLGNLLTETAPGNNAVSSITKTYNYTTDGGYSQADARFQPLTLTDNLGNTTHYRYDAQGNCTVVVDQLGNETDATYNIANCMVNTIFPATGQTGSGRTQVSNAYLYVDGPLIGITEYDENSNVQRQVSVCYGNEGETLARTGDVEYQGYAYDALYRFRAVTDGNNHSTTYYYKQSGYLDAVTFPSYNGPAPVYNPAVGSWSNISGADSVRFPYYDSNGNLLQRIDGNGATTNYVYNDPDSKLTDIEYPASSNLNVHLTFDAYGRRSTQSDGVGNVSYSYDDSDNLADVTTNYTGLPAKSIAYTYYPDDSRQSMSTPAGMYSYEYDKAERMTALTNPSEETASWQYLPTGWLASQTLGNGATTAYSYNARGFLTRLTNSGLGGTTLSDFTNMTYDAVGDPTSVTASIPVLPVYGGSTTYSYDTKYNLTQEQSTRNGGYNNGFTYDDAQNHTTFKNVTDNFNADNQLTNSGFLYDGNGNPTTYHGASLSYDPENRLMAYGTQATFGYTTDGLRAWKQSAAGTTYFLYDGGALVCEMNTAGAVIADETIGAAGLTSRNDVSYQFDPQGNVAHTLDSSGNVLSSSLFDTQGAGISSNGVTAPLGFDAESDFYTDNETGLSTQSQQYYDPATGSNVSRSSSGFANGMNLYGGAVPLTWWHNPTPPSKRPPIAPWPAGTPRAPCTKPTGPAPPGLPPSRGNCNPYLIDCQRGFILACNDYDVCIGTFPWGSATGAGANCLRQCLLNNRGPASLGSCWCSYAQHLACMRICGYSPPWPFDWNTFAPVCSIPLLPLPPLSFPCIATPPGKGAPGWPIWNPQ